VAFDSLLDELSWDFCHFVVALAKNEFEGTISFVVGFILGFELEKL